MKDFWPVFFTCGYLVLLSFFFVVIFFCLIIRNNCKISTLFFLGFELDIVHVFAVYQKMYVNEKSSYLTATCTFSE